MNGQTDERTDRQTKGQTDRRKDRQTNRQTDERTEWTDRWIKGRTDRGERTDRRKDRQTNGQFHHHSSVSSSDPSFEIQLVLRVNQANSNRSSYSEDEPDTLTDIVYSRPLT